MSIKRRVGGAAVALAAAVPGLVFISAGVPAKADPVGDEFLVNTATQGIQFAPAVAADADGDFVVVWQSLAHDGTNYLDVFGQRFDATGAPQGAAFRVNTVTPFDQIEPTVAMDADGDFVIAWTSYLQDGSVYGIYGKRFDADGIAQGGEFLVNTETAGSQESSSVGMDDDGDFVITWRSFQDDHTYDVHGQRFGASGVAQGGEFRVNTSTAGTQGSSSVGMDDDGDFVVTWISYTGDASTGVYAQRFDGSGAAQGSEVRVNEASGGLQGTSIAVDADGDFAITWASFGQDGSGWGVFGQRFDGTGAAQGDDFQVNTTTANTQDSPAMAVEANGDFVVTWTGVEPDGVWRVYGQRFDVSGLAQGGEFAVNTITSGPASDPSVAMDDDGDFVVAWTSADETWSNSDIHGRLFDRRTPEACDGEDNDLDGTVDEGVTTTFYADSDGDGHGDPTVAQQACTPPPGTVSVAGDANDSDGTIYPGAPELDDGKDNDQDGLVDEGFDTDGDGYTPGYGGDANDGDATIHPGAPELCDAKDNDQDGSLDEGGACDSDGDGLSDDEDPDEVMKVVAAVPKSAFGSGGQPKAFKSNLDKAEQLLLGGDERGAITELQALRKRVDGCDGTSRERADTNDWITTCAHQRAVRQAIDSLIAAINEP